MASVAELRDPLNTSRTVGLAILECIDMNKYTVRSGDECGAGPKIIEFSEK